MGDVRHETPFKVAVAEREETEGSRWQSEDANNQVDTASVENLRVEAFEPAF